MCEQSELTLKQVLLRTCFEADWLRLDRIWLRLLRIHLCSCMYLPDIHEDDSSRLDV